MALPQEVQHWSLTPLRQKLVKIGAKVARHGRNITFQMVEVAILKDGPWSRNIKIARQESLAWRVSKCALTARVYAAVQK